MLTTKEAAERLNASYPSIMLWIRRELLPAEQVDTPRGPVWMIPADAIENFEKPSRGRPPAPDSELKYPRRKSRRKVSSK